ncbi:hypothetical protein [Fibrobacter sp. UWB7]|jgi:predicted DNA binding CopG/RHH family protein|uniref:CopG family antitoxin n=1 Tax=Fibrobacter sp. UWB7 TaxID=1896206 RepID=UPI00091BB5DE|nr:hypothetical protein [Fibrobacter sp. UWB7]MDY6333088.1 antitoxin [Fibrobacter sp.]SHM98993.1 hypothetical protein SAMN05720467_2972 [Fibrobacter sp. UWB7]
MKKNYDFSNAVKNPYAKKLKKTICINISESVIAYFKTLSEKTDIPYQVLINMFLAQAKAEKMEPKFIPKSPRKKQVA